MLRYAISVLAEKSEHPLLMSLFVVAILLVAIGFGIDIVRGPGITSGFLAIYAIIGAFMGALGYALVYTAKLILKLQHKYEV